MACREWPRVAAQVVAMALIGWRAAFSTGVPAADEAHRELLERIDEAHRRLMAGEECMTVSGFLGEVLARISAHFAHEERLMREWAYDRLAEHEADHQRLRDAIRQIMEDFEGRRRFEPAALVTQLNEWFGRHFPTHDARLHRRLPH